MLNREVSIETTWNLINQSKKDTTISRIVANANLKEIFDLEQLVCLTLMEPRQQLIKSYQLCTTQYLQRCTLIMLLSSLPLLNRRSSSHSSSAWRQNSAEISRPRLSTLQTMLSSKSNYRRKGKLQQQSVLQSVIKFKFWTNQSPLRIS